MINDEYIIELDEYLDLSYFDLCVKEFKNTFPHISEESKMTGYFSPDLSIEDPKDAKTINLRVVTNNKYVHDWASIDKCERWEDYHTYRLFPNIKKFISTLPFKSVGRVFISFTENKTNIVPHSGFLPEQKVWRQEFIWFSLLGGKRLWATSEDNTKEFYKNDFKVDDKWKRIYNKGISCWFNPELLHGVECKEDFSASLRIDGEFTKEFRKKVFGDTEWKTEFTYVDDISIDPRKSVHEE